METVSIKGATTEVYIKKGLKSEIVVLVFPGNPGVVSFYTLFIDQLHHLLNSNLSFIGVGHAGHGPKGANGGKVFSIKEQVDHKVDVLDYFSESLKEENDEKKAPKFILMGHSIGAYMCLKAANRRPDQVLYIFNLFPTFKNLWNGLAAAVKVAIQPMIRNTLATILHYSPPTITRSILDLSSHLTSEAKYIVANHADYGIINNVLYMAYTEAQEILEKIDPEIENIFKTMEHNLVFIYGTTDPYTPLEYYKETAERLPQAIVELANDGVPHAFVIHHSTEVATQCYLIFNKLKELPFSLE